MQWVLTRGGDGNNDRQSYFYEVTTTTYTYKIMFGIVKGQSCELLEHHWINTNYEVYSLRYQLLPYFKEYNATGGLPMRFATETEAKTFVEHQIGLWETSLDNNS